MTQKFLIAKIDLRFAARSDFAWVPTEQSPYKSIDTIDIDESLLSEVYRLYRSTYAKIDPKLYIRSKEGLLKYNRWVLIYDESQRLVAFALYRDHPFGIKLGLTASSGSSEAKSQLVQMHRSALNQNMVFAEVSPPLENVLSDSVPRLLAEDSARVLGVDLLPDNDRYHYFRKIGGIGTKRKLLVGKPNLSSNPKGDL